MFLTNYENVFGISKFEGFSEEFYQIPCRISEKTVLNNFEKVEILISE